jgi:hypothetical protein
MNRGKYSQTATAIRTFQDVNFKNPRHKSSPRVISSAFRFAGAFLIASAGIRREINSVLYWNNGSAPNFASVRD